MRLSKAHRNAPASGLFVSKYPFYAFLGGTDEALLAVVGSGSGRVHTTCDSDSEFQ
jgi:hypothetical protein